MCLTVGLEVCPGDVFWQHVDRDLAIDRVDQLEHQREARHGAGALQATQIGQAQHAHTWQYVDGARVLVPPEKATGRARGELGDGVRCKDRKSVGYMIENGCL